MKTISKIQEWGNTHHPAWFDFFRIALGLVLMCKGIQFALNLDAFSEMMAVSKLPASFAISLVAHLVILTHIIGGLMIVLGTGTRLACLVLIPILLVAIFYVNLPENVVKPYSELWLSVSVLVALVFFMVEGDGRISVDYEKSDTKMTK